MAFWRQQTPFAEVREDGENFCSTLTTASLCYLHYITRRNCGTAWLELRKIAHCFIAIRQHYTSRAFLVRCRGTPYKLIKCLYLPIISRFLYLSGTISRDRIMNSDEYELQMDQPFASGALRDRRYYIYTCSSSAMLLTGQGPVSDAILCTVWQCHSCQPSRNGRDSPEITSLVPLVSRKDNCPGIFAFGFINNHSIEADCFQYCVLYTM